MPLNMAATVLLPEKKVQNCIVDSWRIVTVELMKYCDIVNLGQKHISLIVAHETTLSNVLTAKIEDTELHRIEPDISLKLQHSIKKEILSEETAINDILKDLQTSYSNIMVLIDKIFNVYKSSNLSTNEIIKGSETSLSFAEMLEALDRFKRSFCDSHDGRKYTIELLNFTENAEKVPNLWNAADLLSLKEELDLILTVE